MSNNNNSGKKISRRRAIEIMGLGLVGAATAMSFKSNPFLRNLPQKVKEGKIKLVDKRKNPKNGDMISLVGFGCMRFPTTGEGGRKAPIDIAKTQELVDYAYAHGINYYDTAYVYHGGKSEGVIGAALKKYPRKSYFLADKMPGYNVRVKEDGPKFFEEQIQRCGVDYFDYYLLHSLQNRQGYDKVYEEMGVYDYLVEQKKKGRIRQLGFSFHGDMPFFDYVIDKHPWDFVQVELNYLDWKGQDAEHIYNALVKRHIPCIVMEPLKGGMLASLSTEADAIFKKANPKATVASWAFRYAGSLSDVMVILSGMTYMEHLEDNIKTFTDFKPLTSADYETINLAVAEYQKFKRIGCTACRYCMPCPFGVEIPTVFATYNQLIMDSNVPDMKAQNTDDYKKKGKAFSEAFHKAFAQGGGPDKCAKCGACLSKCPQHLEIPSLMSMINGTLESL